MMVTTGVVNMAEPDLDATLLGLTEYEFRVYRAMVQSGPATAYRLGKVSGVPLSRVYEVVARLVAKGAAVEDGDDPVRYVPVDPGDLVRSARQTLDGALDRIGLDLSTLGEGGGHASFAQVRGSVTVLDRLIRLTGSAERDVLVAIGSGAGRVLDVVRSAIPAGVRCRSVVMPDGTTNGGPFAVLVDGSQAMVGALGSASDAIVTRHSALVCVLQNLFRAGAYAEIAGEPATAARGGAATQERRADWLGWEAEKHRRLLQAH